jgi:hypothetical protein
MSVAFDTVDSDHAADWRHSTVGGRNMPGSSRHNVSSIREARILEYWRAVEMFNPQKVRRLDPGAQSPVNRVLDGKPLPWQPAHELAQRQRKPGYEWRHTVYVGIYSFDGAWKLLDSVFAPGDESLDERPRGESALCAFVVDSDGTLVTETVVLSSCAWATGRALNPGPATAGWLEGFGEVAKGFALQMREIIADAPLAAQGEPGVNDSPMARIVDHSILERIRIFVRKLVGLEDRRDAFAFSEIRVHSYLVKQTAEIDVGDFLNSFYVEDLAMIAERAEKGDLGTALATYLSEDEVIDKSARIDVRTAIDSVYQGLAPDLMPVGRWVSPAEQPLSAGQQLAVNRRTSARQQQTSRESNCHTPLE